MTTKGKSTNFEDAIIRLEEIVKTLENDTVSLEDSLKLFEEGMELTDKCREKLQTAESRVKRLLRNQSGELEVKEGV